MPRHRTRPEDARVGYEIAAARWAHEGELLWAKYNAMLVANSIILALLASQPSTPGIPRWALGLSGLVLSLMWCLITRRGFDRHHYWGRTTRRLEADAAWSLRAVQDGHRRRRRESGKVRVFAEIVIGTFAALYIGVVVGALAACPCLGW